MMKFYHLILIFLAIYLQNIGDETFALSFEHKYPEICQAHNQMPCVWSAQCNPEPRHPDHNPGVCRHVRNSREKHCVCRRNMLGYSTLSADNLSCDPGDICEKNSDCGRDKWNRKGKCVITKRPNEDGNFEFGDIKMSGSHYKNKHGDWKKHKHCECPPPKFPYNCEGNYKNPCTNSNQCGKHGNKWKHGVCTKYYGGAGKKYCVCRKTECTEGDICKKDKDCGYVKGTMYKGTCEKTITDRREDDLWLYTDMRRCKCGSKTTTKGRTWPIGPTGSDLEEKVAETQRIGNETQRMLKMGQKWLKNLYNAHLEENHDFKEKDAEEKDGHWNNWGEE